jgi:hypothetical protein
LSGGLKNYQDATDKSLNEYLDDPY